MQGPMQESGVTYQVRLVNGLRVRVNVFVVYNHPREVETEEGEIEYEWPSISRRACPKDHCEVHSQPFFPTEYFGRHMLATCRQTAEAHLMRTCQIVTHENNKASKHALPSLAPFLWAAN